MNSRHKTAIRYPCARSSETEHRRFGRIEETAGLWLSLILTVNK